jgi:hemerythrin-like domain-containing protein
MPRAQARSVTRPLRDEHAALRPHIEELRALADAVGEAPIESLVLGLDGVSDFLAHHLIPHAQAEDAVLYPVVDRLLGAPGATATMSREHAVVGRLMDDLAALRRGLSGGEVEPAAAAALRRVLYGLYTLVTTHFDNEEEVYLPLLDARLTPEDARRIFEAMDAAVATEHHHRTA